MMKKMHTFKQAQCKEGIIINNLFVPGLLG